VEGQATGGRGLRADQVRVTYGGHVAVDDVSLAAPLGQVTGLIGPNGAGKTTLFNACSGLLQPASGSVNLFGVDVTSKSTAVRARMGLGRTFQRVEVCNAMSLRTNVALGIEAREVGGKPWRQVFGNRELRRRVDEATQTALEACGITDLAERSTATLSTGQRRLLELARVLAGGFQLLLLDEPSSGLDEEETDSFGAVIQGAVDELGIGVLLVEHDMPLVMQLCRYLYVLDFGRLIFAGTPTEVQASQTVRDAYLGCGSDKGQP
jgi:ABC-type branched-subunit amino acid transport system ATPase component